MEFVVQAIEFIQYAAAERIGPFLRFAVNADFDDGAEYIALGPIDRFACGCSPDNSSGSSNSAAKKVLALADRMMMPSFCGVVLW